MHDTSGQIGVRQTPDVYKRPQPTSVRLTRQTTPARASRAWRFNFESIIRKIMQMQANTSVTASRGVSSVSVSARMQDARCSPSPCQFFPLLLSVFPFFSSAPGCLLRPLPPPPRVTLKTSKSRRRRRNKFTWPECDV